MHSSSTNRKLIQGVHSARRVQYVQFLLTLENAFIPKDISESFVINMPIAIQQSQNTRLCFLEKIAETATVFLSLKGSSTLRSTGSS